MAFFNLRYLQPFIGEQLLAGLVQVCPELGCVGSLCLPRRHRALRGWRRWCPARSCLVWDHLGHLSRRPVDHGGLRPVPLGHVEALGASSPSSVRPPGALTSDLCLMALIGFAVGAAATIQNLRQRQEHRPFSILGAFPAKSMTDPEDGRSSGEDFQLTLTEIHGGIQKSYRGTAPDGRSVPGTSLENLHRRRSLTNQSGDQSKGTVGVGKIGNKAEYKALLADSVAHLPKSMTFSWTCWLACGGLQMCLEERNVWSVLRHCLAQKVVSSMTQCVPSSM